MRKILALLIAVLTLAGLSVQADVLASYGFADTLASDDTDLGSTAGAILNNTGSLSYSGLAQTGPKAAYFGSTGGFFQETEAGAISANDYLSFAVSAGVGNSVALSNLSWYARIDPVKIGAPESYAVYTSADGYTTALGTGTIPETANYEQLSVDLSGITNQSVEVRIYLWTTNGIGGSSDREFRVDTVVLEGQSIVTTPSVTLAHYDMNDTQVSSDTNAQTVADSVAFGPGVVGAFGTYSAAGIPGKGLYFSSYREFYSSTEAEAVTADDYLKFDIAGAPGYGFNARELSFYARWAAAELGAPESYALYSSVDGFSNAVATGTIIGNDAWQLQTIDLTSATGFQTLVDAELRLYFWSADGIGTDTSLRDWRFDELVLKGTTFETNILQAVSVADYGFDNFADTNSGVCASLDSNVETVAANLIHGAGVQPDIESSNVSVRPSSRSLYITNSFALLTLADAVASNDYFSINLTVTNGYKLDLESLSFYVTRQDDSRAASPGPNYGADSYAIYSSQDNFTTPLVVSNDVIPVTSASTAWVENKADLTGLLDPITPLDGIELRLYMYATNGLAGATNQVIRFDDLIVDGFVSIAGYPGFSNDFQLALGPLGDDDSDGWNNLWEYGLGGNPTNGFIDGYIPSSSVSGSTFSYVHPERKDGADDLVYTVEATDNLVSGTWSNINDSAVSTNSLGGNFFEVTNSVPMDTQEKFIRLTLELL